MTRPVLHVHVVHAPALSGACGTVLKHVCAQAERGRAIPISPGARVALDTAVGGMRDHLEAVLTAYPISTAMSNGAPWMCWYFRALHSPRMRSGLRE